MSRWEWVVALGFLRSLAACSGETSDDATGKEPGGIGRPCLLVEESRTDFYGFSDQEIYAAGTTSDVCESELCLVNHFQGRVSCPYGQSAEQAASDPACFVPGSDEPIAVPVDPQIVARPPASTVTCSCQCGGLTDGSLCDCPKGTVCASALPLTGGEDVPRYCMVEGFTYDPTQPPSPEVCIESSANCGDARPYPP
jgi:hypothetical protein